MKYFFSIFITFMSLVPNALAISKSQCEAIAFDNIKFHTEERNQENIGYCWAFAATALLEEKRCQKDPTLCHKHLSVLDVSRCTFKLGMPKNQGFYTDLALNCAINGGGVCNEKDAPYSNATYGVCKAMSFSPDSPNQIIYSKEKNCGPKQVRMAFFDLEVAKLKICNDSSIPKEEKFLELQSTIYDIYTRLQPYTPEKFLKFTDLINYATTSATEDEFMAKVYIPKSCEENRATFSNMKPEFEDIKNLSLDQKVKYIEEHLTDKQSFSIQICSTQVSKGFWNNLFNSDEKDNCGAHEVVVNGARWRNGECQVHIKNSWGQGSPISGWQSAEIFLKTSKTMSYIK